MCSESGNTKQDWERSTEERGKRNAPPTYAAGIAWARTGRNRRLRARGGRPGWRRHDDCARRGLRHHGEPGPSVGRAVSPKAPGRERAGPRGRLGRGDRQFDRRQLRFGQLQPRHPEEGDLSDSRETGGGPQGTRGRLRRPGGLRPSRQPHRLDLPGGACGDLRRGRPDHPLAAARRAARIARARRDRPRRPPEQFRHLRLLSRGRAGQEAGFQARLAGPQRVQGRGRPGRTHPAGHRLQRDGLLHTRRGEKTEGLQTHGPAGD